MQDTRLTADQFPVDAADLPASRPVEAVDLADGDRFQLRISPVSSRLGGATVRLLAFNGSVPGPTLRVRQGTEVEVTVVNDGDLDTTVHWHGLRLDNRFDGTLATQAAIPVGGAFAYRLAFPDPGIYWYHPHVREDYGQEMGLYGSIVVVPADAAYWPPAHREVALTLDDILIEDGGVAPFSRQQPTFTAMGRFGNVLLVNGEQQPSLRARRGEVVRLYLTNTANTRVFRVGIPGARMKLVGGDSGRYEREAFVDDVVIAPSERAVIDVLFDRPGEVALEHSTPARTYRLAAIAVAAAPAQPPLAREFNLVRTNEELARMRTHMAVDLWRKPDKTLALVAEMNMGDPDMSHGAAVEYFCPMDADVVASEPGRCPTCGMKLLARPVNQDTYVCPMHPDVTSSRPDRCSACGMKLIPARVVATAAHAAGHTGRHGDDSHDHHEAPDSHRPDAPTGIEWEDDMVEVNRMTNPTNTRWKLVDRQTGDEGKAIDWRFRVGDRVKIRIVNEMDSDHPMHHPFHVHGAGRFLVLARNGVEEANLVWKDTVLVTTGETVDILLDVTHPGEWMAHCHIAEHHESGMMLHFHVDKEQNGRGGPRS